MTSAEEFLARVARGNREADAHSDVVPTAPPPSEDYVDPREPQLEALGDRLAELRMSGSAADGRVAAEVDGNGRVVDIRIDDRALRQPHPHLLGSQVLEAITTARTSAAQVERRLVDEVMRGGELGERR